MNFLFLLKNIFIFIIINLLIFEYTKAIKCKPLADCLNHKECGGLNGKIGTNRCSGLVIGKCHCAACIASTPCVNDSQCGGLYNGCDQNSKKCNCLQAISGHYSKNINKTIYSNTMEYMKHLCLKEDCKNSIINCHGLPCL
ncbi:hypothetical protein Mgra_00005346, partial [Meloidogyne graminicola]